MGVGAFAVGVGGFFYLLAGLRGVYAFAVRSLRPPCLARTEQGVALYLGLTTQPVFWPLLLSVRARAFALAGRPAEGLSLIDEAISITTCTRSRTSPRSPAS